MSRKGHKGDDPFLRLMHTRLQRQAQAKGQVYRRPKNQSGLSWGEIRSVSRNNGGHKWDVPLAIQKGRKRKGPGKTK